jgi:glutamyl-tRNA synthetase
MQHPPGSAPAPRGRYAPSPTGWLHLGNAWAALAAWLSARAAGGAFVWRLEDLDGPRVVPGAAEAAVEDLRWLGLDWDEGPDVGGPHAPYEQSARGVYYEAALGTLLAGGHLFPCTVSRKDLLSLASAPHGAPGLPPYPPELRPHAVPDGWYDALQVGTAPGAAVRFRVHGRPVSFPDRVQGTVTERVDQTVGDFVLKRRDGLYAYQLAVVVDDLLMGIDEVVRGADLLDSTARQIQLIGALGGTPPAYAHLPLVLNSEGEKLSKRDAPMALRALRARGIRAEQVVGYLGFALGLLPRPEACSARDLAAAFDWSLVRTAPWRVPDDLPSQLSRLR